MIARVLYLIISSFTPTLIYAAVQPVAAYYYSTTPVRRQMGVQAGLRTMYYPPTMAAARVNCQNRCYTQSSQSQSQQTANKNSNNYRWVFRPTNNGVSYPAAASLGTLPYIQFGRPAKFGASNNSGYPWTAEMRPLAPVLPPEERVTSTIATTTAEPYKHMTTIFTTFETSQQAVTEMSVATATEQPLTILIYPKRSFQGQTTVVDTYSTTSAIPKVNGFGGEILLPYGLNVSTSTRRQNPCPASKPLTSPTGTPVTCNFVVQPNGGCPDGFWCHTGSSFDTTTCCPNYNSKDRCHSPKTSGDGDDLIPRWYYDSDARKCKRFLYKGLRGNANNFITSVQCMESCEIVDRAATYKNPCGSNPPARDLDGALFVCGPFAGLSVSASFHNGNAPGAKCPLGYFCHVGESIETTACCEHSSVRDPCLLTLNIGEGSANLQRFHYDVDAQKCVEFVYRGIHGNENNFLTVHDCQRACMKYNDPCPAVEFSHDGRRRSCALKGVDACERNEWCHVGADGADTTVCCPNAVIDPCTLPLDVGRGGENLTRWYAVDDDVGSGNNGGSACRRQCRPFIYHGTKGNQNNFISREQCEIVCKPECVNPCSSGTLLIDHANGRPQFCSVAAPCPNNYWCHYGTTPATSVCCSAVKRPCSLPLAEGDGQAVLGRWYYNKRDAICKKFIYRGIGGNQNNYVSRDECLNACSDDDDADREAGTSRNAVAAAAAAIENSCGSGGRPLLVDGVRAKVCSPEHRCPGTHFCHIGAGDNVPNVCCPKNGDPCDHPVAVGQGAFAIRRFYFDRSTRTCRDFTYHGAKGNANNFLTLSDCELVCRAGVLRNPCASGAPLTDDASGEAIVCGGDELCPVGYFCHVGGAPETTNCCPFTSKRNPCELELVVGEGNERLERWYFDADAQTCQRFVYAGLKGNANNFLSETACREHCLGENSCLVSRPLTVTDKYGATSVLASCRASDPLSSCPSHTHFCHVGVPDNGNVCCTRSALEVCELPVNHGVGNASLKRWYHNVAHGKCESFLYGGARGNENNFISRHICEQNCPSYRNYCPHGSPLLDERDDSLVLCGISKNCPRGFVCHMNAQFDAAVCCEDPTNFCLQARDAGPCDGAERRYGYNSLTDTCVAYDYGGCGGTLNNFPTKERCTEICCREYRHRMHDDPNINQTKIPSKNERITVINFSKKNTTVHN